MGRRSLGDTISGGYGLRKERTPFAKKDTPRRACHLLDVLRIQVCSSPPQELGGAPPPELMGEEYSGSRPGLGLKRSGGPNDGLPDDCKLYVGSLPAGFSDSQLKSMFEPFGAVTHAVVLQDQTPGQSRGFGFVHFQEASNAMSAKEGMNGKQVDGRALVVKLRSEPPGAGAPPKGPQPGVVDESKLYVGFLPYTVTDDQLRGLFSAYAPVVEARIVTDRVTGQSKGFGFVNMASPEGAQTAKLGLDGYTMPEGKRIIVRVAGLKPEAPANPAFNRTGSGAGGSFSSPYGGPRPMAGGYGPPAGYGAGYGAPYLPGGGGGVYGAPPPPYGAYGYGQGGGYGGAGYGGHPAFGGGYGADYGAAGYGAAADPYAAGAQAYAGYDYSQYGAQQQYGTEQQFGMEQPPVPPTDQPPLPPGVAPPPPPISAPPPPPAPAENVVSDVSVAYGMRECLFLLRCVFLVLKNQLHMFPTAV